MAPPKFIQKKLVWVARVESKSTNAQLFDRLLSMGAIVRNTTSRGVTAIWASGESVYTILGYLDELSSLSSSPKSVSIGLTSGEIDGSETESALNAGLDRSFTRFALVSEALAECSKLALNQPIADSQTAFRISGERRLRLVGSSSRHPIFSWEESSSKKNISVREKGSREISVREAVGKIQEEIEYFGQGVFAQGD